ncbi:MAG: tetratricopeptide repeat protein [Acidobacteriota bacterium]|nr:tetratricopeptide repeat protein [Acidobacteriota bacterium]
MIRPHHTFVAVLVAAGILSLRPMELQAQSIEVQLAFQHGATALREGRPAEAEREFRNAIRLDPTLAEAHLDLGLVLGREGKSAEAIESLKQALILNPHLEAGHMFLGVFLYQMGRNEEAISQLQQELAQSPKNREALSWLGIVELASGHPELATGPFDAALELSPDDLTLLEYRGRAHSQVAAESYSRMAKVNPDSWQVHKVRAELLVSENKDREAVAEYQAALNREKNNPDVYEGLGDAYRRLNELEPAGQAYAQELALAPRNPIAMYNLGSTDIDRGDYAAGVLLIEAMLKNYDASPTAEYYLGRGLAESNHEVEAVTWLERTAKSDPKGELAKRSYYELSRLYRKMHRPEDAARTLAAYNHLRESDDLRNAGHAADWRKLNATAPTPAAADAANTAKP